MRNNGGGRVSVRGARNVRKVLLVPAALAVTVISAACGDDAPQLAECSAVPQTGNCQFCLDIAGNKSCGGDQACVLDQTRGVCEKLIAA